MLKRYNSRLFHFGGLIFCALVLLAYNANPPNGRTGAPFDGSCNNCHAGGSYSAAVALSGLPATIQPNTLYNLTLTVTPSGGNPLKGGYQLVVVANNNTNCGNLTATDAQSGTEMFGGREYIDHRGGKTFGGNPISWDFDWTSPASVNGNVVKFYYIANLTNNDGDDTGDNAISFLESYTFSGPPPVTATIISTTNLLCNGVNTGSATVEAGGGVSPYTYLWSNGQTTETAINLGAGTYTVTVTGSGGSGTSTASATITQPPAITLSANVAGTLTCINTSVTATATAGGGTPPFSYEWSNGDVGNQATIGAIGTYFVTATDGNGCTKTASVTVTGNTQTPIANAQAGGSVTCQQPVTSLSGVGSSSGPNFTYLWTTPDGNIVSGANTLSPLVNEPGTYTLLVTNTSNGCTSEASTTVSGDIQPPVVSASGGQLTCLVTSVVLTANGNEPATYAWVGPNNFTSNLQNPSVGSAGVYTVTVTAADNGCSATATATVSSNTTPPVITTSGGVLNCINTSVQLNVASNPPSSVIWVGPNNFTSTLPNPVVSVAGVYTVTATATGNSCTASGTATVSQNTTAPQLSVTNGILNCSSTSDTLHATSTDTTSVFTWVGPGFSFTGANAVISAPGTYTVTATSSTNGCTTTSTATVTQNITPPTAIAVSPEEITCAEPSIQLDATASSQGTSFQYQWTTINGNIVAGANTLTPTVNATGIYNLAITNTNNGCTSAASVTVAQDPPLTVQTGNITAVNCFGTSTGSATVTAAGGDGSYGYNWSNGDTLATVTGLAAGTYSVSVSDGSGCSVVTGVTIIQPDMVVVNASATPESALGANDGMATAAPTGGTPPYTYLWSNGATTQTITGLVPGPYTVTLLDANGCTAVQTVTVNSFNCNISSSISSTPVSCNGGGDGTATTTITGAADPVIYQWSNGATTASVSNLVAGTYTVSITDANNCPAVLTVSIGQPAPISTNATATPETASGANDGTATANPTGGIAPYTYLWNTGSTAQTITGLAPGSYTVSVTDANFCTKEKTVQVNSFNCLLIPNITSANVSCFGGSDGLATVSIDGGTLPFQYEWSNGTSNATNSGLTAGTYSVSVEDANGCVVTDTVTINQPPALSVDSIFVSNVACPESTNGSVMIDVAGGVAPYLFSTNLSNLAVGNYSVVITDANGCTLTTGFEIESNDQTPPELMCPSETLTACTGEVFNYPLPVATDNCSLVGVQPVLLSGLPPNSIFPVGTTVQTYQVTDASGNTATCSFEVKVNPAPVITVDAVHDDVDAAGVGSIEVSISGGTGGPYTYAWTGTGGFTSTMEDIFGLFSAGYILTIVDVFGCETQSNLITVDFTVDAGETLPSEFTARIVPNPAFSHIRLETTGRFDITAASLFDSNGRLVRILTPVEIETELDISNFAQGLYIMRIQNEKGEVEVLKWFKSAR